MKRPLLALHGMLGTPAMFDPLGDAPRYAPFLPGHGPRPDVAVTTFDAVCERWADELEARFGSAPIDVLGYSMGARFALAFCARHPRRFHRAVLVSAHPGLANDDVAARAARRAEDEAAARLLETRGLEAFVDEWETKPIFASQMNASDAQRAAQRVTRLSHRPNGIAFALRRFGLAEMPSWEPAVAAMTDRMAFLTGGADAKFAPIAERLATTYPALDVQILPGIGHNPWLEAPVLAWALVAELFSLQEQRP